MRRTFFRSNSTRKLGLLRLSHSSFLMSAISDSSIIMASLKRTMVTSWSMLTRMRPLPSLFRALSGLEIIVRLGHFLFFYQADGPLFEVLLSHGVFAELHEEFEVAELNAIAVME